MVRDTRIANNTSKVYGSAVPVLSATVSGLVNGDASPEGSTNAAPSYNSGDTLTGTVGGQILVNTTATNSSNVSGSPYKITPNLSGLSAAM